MPWFLNPAVYNGLPLLQNPEFYYFIAKLAVTLVFARRLAKRGVRGRALAAAAWTFFYGLFITVMLGLHAFVILGLRWLERAPGEPFTYDFELYALMLLAGVLIPQGIECMRLAAGIGQGGAAERRRVRVAALVVLAAAFPLIPIQLFGSVLTLKSVVMLGLLRLSADAGVRKEVTSSELAEPALV